MEIYRGSPRHEKDWGTDGAAKAAPPDKRGLENRTIRLACSSVDCVPERILANERATNRVSGHSQASGNNAAHSSAGTSGPIGETRNPTVKQSKSLQRRE